MRKNSIVYCYVAGCRTNSQKFPNKLFVNVPKDPAIRDKWMKAARRTIFSPKSVFRCCEDHFDLKNDVKNWMKFRFVRGPLYLKDGVIPRFFNFNQKPKPIEPVDLKKNTYHDHNYARIHIEGAFGVTEVSSNLNTADETIKKELTTSIKQEVEVDPNQHENELEKNIKDLYPNHVIKEEMVIGPVVVKKQVKEAISTDDYVDYDPFEFNNDVDTNIKTEIENKIF